ncbi:hypothetical protein [Dyadobacter sp. CY312]|uniref:hypothetical protein n=1 Tax=Dyadobacter sp. CY312 TaxID=2907303 RepID=UPI001F1EAD52|nr:hypothetical protein [Dyadobacter sp. CY312]MCE7044563.1 hypothetical protein [Dyadobacter sp. CY312]
MILPTIKDRLMLGALALGTIVFLTAVVRPHYENNHGSSRKMTSVIKVAQAPGSIETSDSRLAESKAAFLKAYTVFMHPRCMNCHPKGDIPLQGDDSHLHLQGVQRGPEGKGVLALKCKNCHQDTNLKGNFMPPGNPHWQMPPMNRKMAFEGKSPKQLAQHFLDNDFTGFKKMEDMIEHVETESLVLNSFVPIDGRATLPMSHEEFVATVKEWIEKGAAIPDK